MDTDASAAPTTPAMDPERLTTDQLRGLNCAYCKTRLYRARSIGTVRVGPVVIAEDVRLYACAPACNPAIALEPHGWCFICHDPVDKETAITVGFVESLPAPGRPTYADDKCFVAYRLYRLDEHPAGTDGRPRYRDREPFAPRFR
ncbi:hypothetical protein G3I60_17250 [Streptomyces sp. SID13666]|uniref:hypothetical protein n=1 Tax=unclassified Streptomyces TaxID=2593676 RepID=UPI0013BEE800|nr:MULTISPECIES: hypothetical protein [unclassified Streptomyces]NEA55843.1 hypothetical protein [Streptomyces sp. SID13666]NEA71309.1 hypothetical protein [Streptomyces sp. SID13588]